MGEGKGVWISRTCIMRPGRRPMTQVATAARIACAGLGSWGRSMRAGRLESPCYADLLNTS